jgi:hypothetical protein
MASSLFCLRPIKIIIPYSVKSMISRLLGIDFIFVAGLNPSANISDRVGLRRYNHSLIDIS